MGEGRGVEERFFIRTLAKRVPGLEVRWTGGQAPAGASLSGCYWPSLRWAQGWLVFLIVPKSVTIAESGTSSKASNSPVGEFNKSLVNALYPMGSHSVGV